MFGSVSPLDHNLILTGYIGPGQVGIARRCAEQLRIPFIDFAARFEERAEMTTDDLKAQYGDARMRSVESDLVAELSLARGSLIHVSGQVLQYGDRIAALGATGPVFCLVATLDAVLTRLHVALGARYHNPKERSLALGSLRREWEIRSHPGIQEIDATDLDDTALIALITQRWRNLTGVIDWRG